MELNLNFINFVSERNIRQVRLERRSNCIIMDGIGYKKI
jgi:hypothetical protein